jgi:cytochrome c peroxidase
MQSQTLFAGALAALVLCAGCHDDSPSPPHPAAAVLAAPVVAVATAAASTSTPHLVPRWVRYPAVPTTLSPAAQLGRRLFFDPALSASGKQSCASCHSPEHAYGPPNDLSVQLGGPDMKQPGRRAVPSLRYLEFTPKFTRDYRIPGPDDSEEEGPTGGFTYDGAVDSLHEQALIPLLSPYEMANRNAAAVTARLRDAGYAAVFKQVSGTDLGRDPQRALEQATLALEAFQLEDPSFRPYTSKFDAVMSNHADFTAAELRGFSLFNNPAKGNCAQCHVNVPGPGGRPAQFTDFGLVAIGVPRNRAIPANRDPHYVDLGVCGPYRKDQAKQTDLCGLFMTPSLRNVATRHVFFHNGVFHTLEETMHFYVERDTDPRKWYPRVHGKVVKYDDLPPRYDANIDTIDGPMNLKTGDAPALDESEIHDVIAFLGTLDDGYSSVSGGAARH